MGDIEGPVNLLKFIDAILRSQIFFDVLNVTDVFCAPINNIDNKL